MQILRINLAEKRTCGLSFPPLSGSRSVLVYMQFRKYQGHPNCCRILYDLSYFVYQHLSTIDVCPDEIRNIFLFCLSLSSRSLVVCCFSMRIANDRSIHGLLHDVEQHYECSNRWDGCAFAQATSALDAETDLTIQKASDMHLQWISQVWDVFLDSPRCCWLFFSSPFPHFWTHWTHFEEVIRSDFNCTIITIAHRIQTLFLGQIRTERTMKLQCLKRRNQRLNLFKFKCQVGLWQGCSLWRRKSGRVWLAPGARLQWNMSNSALENFPKHCEKIISCTFIILSGRNWWRGSPSSKHLPKKGEQCERRQTTSENSEVSAFHNVSLELCSATMKPFSNCAG